MLDEYRSRISVNNYITPCSHREVFAAIAIHIYLGLTLATGLHIQSVVSQGWYEIQTVYRQQWGLGMRLVYNRQYG